MKSTISLIRHGITEGNVRRLYYGATNVPLAQEGIDELKRLAAEGIYPDPANAQFFTTGMGRTQQTLELIYGDRPHEIIKDLREINFGMFEMKSYEELMAYEEYREWIAALDIDKAPPGGESIRHFNERVIRGFRTVEESHQRWIQAAQTMDEKRQDLLPGSIVICHGGTISAVMDHIWPGVQDNMYGWLPDPGHGYQLLLEDDAVCEYEMI